MVNSAPAKPGRHAHAASAIFLYSLERGSPEPIKATLPENWSERDDGGAPSPLRSPSCRPVVLLSWANDVRRHFAFTSTDLAASKIVTFAGTRSFGMTNL
jgi:hypothetical protein